MTQLVAQTPRGHNVRLLDYVSDPAEHLWYVRQTIENGWSRNVLSAQVESGLYHRQGRAVTKFVYTLPAPQSDLARCVFDSGYEGLIQETIAHIAAHGSPSVWAAKYVGRNTFHFVLARNEAIPVCLARLHQPAYASTQGGGSWGCDKSASAHFSNGMPRQSGPAY